MQDVLTPRSNRSVDSGLPHDDITPRSDSLSTASSSATPPDQQQHQPLQHQPQMTQREIQQQHRKSTSLDDINIGHQIQQQQAQGSQWKSSSLQRGVAPPNGGIYGTIGSENGDGTLAIRHRNGPAQRAAQQTADDEDPYGRCMNMRLTSFSETNGGSGNPRDPRIIDLTYANGSSTPPSSTSVSVASTPRQGSPVHLHFAQNGAQFNTLPANGGMGGPAMAPNGRLQNQVSKNDGCLSFIFDILVLDCQFCTQHLTSPSQRPFPAPGPTTTIPEKRCRNSGTLWTSFQTL